MFELYKLNSAPDKSSHPDENAYGERVDVFRVFVVEFCRSSNYRQSINRVRQNGKDRAKLSQIKN